MRAAYIWNGGASPLEGKTYATGEEIDPAVVDGLRSKKALLSMGKIKMVTVGEDEPSSAVIVEDVPESEPEDEPSVEVLTKKTPVKKKSQATKKKSSGTKKAASKG